VVVSKKISRKGLTCNSCWHSTSFRKEKCKIRWKCHLY